MFEDGIASRPFSLKSGGFNGSCNLERKFRNNWRCMDIATDLMINEEIREREVRVVNQNGEQLGIMPTAQALELAEQQELDLVNIAPNARPPVCKLMDYGKYRFEMSKK